MAELKDSSALVEFQANYKRLKNFMARKILVVSTSLCVNANIDILADEFIKGTVSSGHDVEKIYLI